MFEDDDADGDSPTSKRPLDPQQRAKERIEGFRMESELIAAFEGPRKFDAELLTDLPFAAARDVQQTIGKLEKARPAPAHLFVPDEGAAEARRLLSLVDTYSTNDFHLTQRPGETHVLRILRGPEVDAYYGRLQAHFDFNRSGLVEDERTANGWRNDPAHAAFVDALESHPWVATEFYYRDLPRKAASIGQPLYLLSTQTVDEVNIELISDQIMNRTASDLVGDASAPRPDDDGEPPTDADRTWFLKLFFLRGLVGDEERILLYAFLQKSDDSFDF